MRPLFLILEHGLPFLRFEQPPVRRTGIGIGMLLAFYDLDWPIFSPDYFKNSLLTIFVIVSDNISRQLD